MLLMVGKGIRGAIRHSIYLYAKADNKHMKDYDKNKSSYIQYWDVYNSYCWATSQKLPVNNFDWIKDTSQFNEDYIKKTTMKEVMKDIFLKLMFNILKTYMNFIMIYHSNQNKLKIKNIEKFVPNLHDKTEYVIHIRNLKQALSHGLVF